MGDIYIVNKLDLEGANTLYNTISYSDWRYRKKTHYTKKFWKNGYSTRESSQNDYKM